MDKTNFCPSFTSSAYYKIITINYYKIMNFMHIRSLNITIQFVFSLQKL